MEEESKWWNSRILGWESVLIECSGGFKVLSGVCCAVFLVCVELLLFLGGLTKIQVLKLGGKLIASAIKDICN